MDQIPLWIKIAYTLFICVLVPVYWVQYGPGNFLWFSDIALFVTAAALWLETRRINTRATAYNTLDYMHARHLHSVVICSSDFHLYRTVRSFRESGKYHIKANPDGSETDI